MAAAPAVMLQCIPRRHGTRRGKSGGASAVCAERGPAALPRALRRHIQWYRGHALRVYDAGGACMVCARAPAAEASVRYSCGSMKPQGSKPWLSVGGRLAMRAVRPHRRAVAKAPSRGSFAIALASPSVAHFRGGWAAARPCEAQDHWQTPCGCVPLPADETAHRPHEALASRTVGPLSGLQTEVVFTMSRARGRSRGGEGLRCRTVPSDTSSDRIGALGGRKVSTKRRWGAKEGGGELVGAAARERRDTGTPARLTR